MAEDVIEQPQDLSQEPPEVQMSPVQLTQSSVSEAEKPMAKPSIAWEEEYPGLSDEERGRIRTRVRPPKSPDFWEKTEAAFEQFGSISQLNDMEYESVARRYGRNGIPREELLRDLPKQFHAEVLATAETYNDDAAMAQRDNMIEDTQNSKIFNDMPWYAQIGYGGFAVIADPITLLAGGPITKGVVAASTATRAWQTHGTFKGMAHAGIWFGAGSAETALQGLPRLSADYTYNSSDYVLDTLAGGLIGTGMGAAFVGGKRFMQKNFDTEAQAEQIQNLETTANVFDDASITQLDTRTPLDEWEELVANKDNLDLSGKGLKLTKEGEVALASAKKEAGKSYGRILEGRKLSELSDQEKVLAKEAYDSVRRIAANSDNYVLPKKPNEFEQSPQAVEIERRKSNNVLMEDYAENIHESNAAVQQELKAHILTPANVGDAQATYVSQEVSANTGTGATLATEIKNGQAILVEVTEQAGEAPVVSKPDLPPNVSENLPQDIDNAINSFVRSGEHEIDQIARKSNNPLQSIVRGANAVLANSEISQTFSKSSSKAMNYVAARLTETGQGFGGKRTRKASAAVVRDSNFFDAQMQLSPVYRDAITEFAGDDGGVAQFLARNEAGADNPVVEKFNRSFMELQELRRQGADTSHLPPAVHKFADGWDKSMDISFNHMVKARVAGFAPDRKIANYYTQSWLPDKLVTATKKHGKDKILDVLALGYRTAAKQTKPITVAESQDLAERMVSYIKAQRDRTQMDDDYVSTAGQDARSKSRLNVNTTAEIDGLSVMDLLDTDVIGVGTRYNNRAAGWSALSDATNGLLNSDDAVQAFRTKAETEGADATALKHYDDVVTMLLGKPVRGGLHPALREFKDLAALTQLGGKGIAQLAETGVVITRNVIKAFSDPKNLKYMMRNIKGNADDLSIEAQQLSHISNDMEWLERQSTHTDTAESIGKVHHALGWLANKATGGSKLKANAGRLLGKVSGFNMIRRTQNRIVQAALLREMAEQMTKGTSKVGEARLKDLGLLNSKGKNPWLAATLRQHAEFDTDGVMVKMNFEKWPAKIANEVRYALLRDQAQNIQRTLVGELPGWMNSPMAGLVMQYREMPMVAMNKSLGRAVAFADREAVVGTVLSAMTAGMAMSGRQLVVKGSDATIGHQEMQDVDLEAVQVGKYINVLGMYPDLYDLVLNDGWEAQQNGTSAAWADFTMRQVPTLGLGQAYVNRIRASADPEHDESMKQLIQNTQTLTPLGNTMLGDAMFTFMMEKL